MADRAPIETKNLDGYGNAPLPWRRPRGDRAAGPFLAHTTFLGTTRPDGREKSSARDRVGGRRIIVPAR